MGKGKGMETTAHDGSTPDSYAPCMQVSHDQWDELCERLVAGDTQGLTTLFQAGICGPDAISPYGESLLSFAAEL